VILVCPFIDRSKIEFEAVNFQARLSDEILNDIVIIMLIAVRTSTPEIIDN
jgi:hypothetical protein